MIDGAKVVAVCDTNAARVATGRERAVGAETFADHRAMLDTRRDGQQCQSTYRSNDSAYALPKYTPAERMNCPPFLSSYRASANGNNRS